MLTKYGSVIIALIIVYLLFSYNPSPTLQEIPNIPIIDLQSFPIPTKKNRKKRTGKIENAPVLPALYTKMPLPMVAFPTISVDLSIALQDQLKLLKRRKQEQSQVVGNLEITLDQLKETIETLVFWQRVTAKKLTEALDAYQIKGRDGRGNVFFTGYFTPVIKVAATPSANFPYPIYTKPDKEDWVAPYPSRVQIDGQGVLEGKGLELAYAKNLTDIYFMQLQGSGIVEYPTGRQEYLSFMSTNGHSYRSIEKYIINNEDIRIKDISMDGIKQFLRENPSLEKPILFANPSYVFFSRKRDRPHGAGHVPLAAGYSIAVDPAVIPLGSCLLAAVPMLDQEGRFLYHDYKILLAQDIGGAIRGSGRVDVYCGIGRKAQNKAMAFHHYGKLFWLLPKGIRNEE